MKARGRAASASSPLTRILSAFFCQFATKRPRPIEIRDGVCGVVFSSLLFSSLLFCFVPFRVAPALLFVVTAVIFLPAIHAPLDASPIDRAVVCSALRPARACAYVHARACSDETIYPRNATSRVRARARVERYAIANTSARAQRRVTRFGEIGEESAPRSAASGWITRAMTRAASSLFLGTAHSRSTMRDGTRRSDGGTEAAAAAAAANLRTLPHKYLVVERRRGAWRGMAL